MPSKRNSKISKKKGKGKKKENSSRKLSSSEVGGRDVQVMESVVIHQSTVIDPETGAVQETQVAITPVKGVFTLADVKKNLLEEEEKLKRQQNDVLKLSQRNPDYKEPPLIPPPPHYTEKNFTQILGLMSCAEIRKHLEKTKLSDEDKVAFVEQNLSASKSFQKYVKKLNLDPKEFQATLEAAHGVTTVMRGQVEEYFGIMFDSYDLDDPDCIYLKELIENIKKKKKGTLWRKRLDNAIWLGKTTANAATNAATNAISPLVLDAVKEKALLAANKVKQAAENTKQALVNLKDGAVKHAVKAGHYVGDRIKDGAIAVKDHANWGANRIKQGLTKNNEALGELLDATTNLINTTSGGVVSTVDNTKSTDLRGNIKKLYTLGFDVFKWILAHPVLAYLAIQQIQRLKDMICEGIGNLLGKMAGNNIVGSREALLSLLKMLYPDIKDPFKEKIKAKTSSLFEAANLVGKSLHQKLLVSGFYGNIGEMAVKTGMKILPVALEMINAGAKAVPYVGPLLGLAVDGLSGIIVASTDDIAKQVKLSINEVAKMSAQENCFRALLKLFSPMDCLNHFKDAFITELQLQKDHQDIQKMMRMDDGDDDENLVLSEGALRDKEELLKQKLAIKEEKDKTSAERKRLSAEAKANEAKRIKEQEEADEKLKGMNVNEQREYLVEKLKRQKEKEKEDKKKQLAEELKNLTPEQKRIRLDQFNDERVARLDKIANEELRLKGLTPSQKLADAEKKKGEKDIQEKEELEKLKREANAKIEALDKNAYRQGQLVDLEKEDEEIVKAVLNGDKELGNKILYDTINRDTIDSLKSKYENMNEKDLTKTIQSIYKQIEEEKEARKSHIFTKQEQDKEAIERDNINIRKELIKYKLALKAFKNVVGPKKARLDEIKKERQITFEKNQRRFEEVKQAQEQKRREWLDPKEVKRLEQIDTDLQQRIKIYKSQEKNSLNHYISQAKQWDIKFLKHRKKTYEKENKRYYKEIQSNEFSSDKQNFIYNSSYLDITNEVLKARYIAGEYDDLDDPEETEEERLNLSNEVRKLKKKYDDDAAERERKRLSNEAREKKLQEDIRIKKLLKEGDDQAQWEIDEEKTDATGKREWEKKQRPYYDLYGEDKEEEQEQEQEQGQDIYNTEKATSDKLVAVKPSPILEQTKKEIVEETKKTDETLAKGQNIIETAKQTIETTTDELEKKKLEKIVENLIQGEKQLTQTNENLKEVEQQMKRAAAKGEVIKTGNLRGAKTEQLHDNQQARREQQKQQKNLEIVLNKSNPILFQTKKAEETLTKGQNIIETAKQTIETTTDELEKKKLEKIVENVVEGEKQLAQKNENLKEVVEKKKSAEAKGEKYKAGNLRGAQHKELFDLQQARHKQEQQQQILEAKRKETEANEEKKRRQAEAEAQLKAEQEARRLSKEAKEKKLREDIDQDEIDEEIGKREFEKKQYANIFDQEEDQDQEEEEEEEEQEQGQEIELTSEEAEANEKAKKERLQKIREEALRNKLKGGKTKHFRKYKTKKNTARKSIKRKTVKHKTVKRKRNKRKSIKRNL